MMFLLDISMKATIILAGAGVVSLLLRRYSAAARHLLWTGVMVALLLLPLASLVLPAWGVLPYWVGPERLAVGADVSELPVVTAVAELQVEQSATPQSVFESGLQERGATTALPQGASGVRLSASEWIAWVYLFGVFVVVVPLVFAPVYLRRLVRAAGRLEWRLLGEVCRELGVRRSVRLFRGGGCSMPLTFGVRHPVILLPATAENWSEDRRRTVLLHEL
ncbi:MAG: hypothetical protein FWD53_08280, partial [Phycisphaerales bacterium]|nr:hypothetical protein [Phycisphaerales bacterium]